MKSAHAGRFDDRYYRRFYGRGGAHDRRRIAHLATGVHHLAGWWGVRIASVLDVGAGIGMWRDWYTENHPRVRVESTDISEYACATWGHQLRDISVWTPPKEHDLVVCHSVLQYLDDRRATSAIDNLAAGTRHLLYLEVPTTSDLENLVDPEGTDMQVHRRSGSWYRRRLNRHYRQLGAGLWMKHDRLVMYELEAVAPPSR